MSEPAKIEYDNGRQEWWLNGRMHREDGPAIAFNGLEMWYFHGKLHREDGPAIECEDGHKEWWIHGDFQYEESPPTHNWQEDGF